MQAAPAVEQGVARAGIPAEHRFAGAQQADVGDPADVDHRTGLVVSRNIAAWKAGTSGAP
jgi:hypothetical protein